MAACIVFHCRRHAPVGVALAQDRVDGAAQHPGVTGLDGFLVSIGRAGRIVGDGIALGLQLRDRGGELRNRGADVGQFDDVRLRGLGQFAQLGQRIALALYLGQFLAMMRPASEMSRVSTDTPAAEVKACTIGRNEWVASAGASSVSV